MSEQRTPITSASVIGALGRAGFEVVQPTESANQLRLVGRVQGDFVRNWLVLTQFLLQSEARAVWSLDVSRQYFLRGDQLVYAWRLIFQGQNIAAHYNAIAQTIQKAPRARFEVQEQALPGVRGQRTMQNKRGKGAAPAGTPPLLVRQKGGMG